MTAEDGKDGYSGAAEKGGAGRPRPAAGSKGAALAPVLPVRRNGRMKDKAAGQKIKSKNENLTV